MAKRLNAPSSAVADCRPTFTNGGTMNIWDFPVHPAAQVFPMLAADELNELADDIKANGLVHALVVKDGILIDGRNRREACRIAGVDPATVELNGADPIAYILSSNINRRHMTKGQRAMAVAMIYPEPEKGGRGNKSSVSEEFSGTRVSMARTVLKWAPEMAEQVLAGFALDKAYETASERKLSAEAPIKRLETLRARDPDLADKVVEEALSLDDAEGAARDRRARERASRQGTYDALRTLDQYLYMFCEQAQRDQLLRIMQENPEEISKDDVLKSITAWIDGLTQTKEGMINA